MPTPNELYDRPPTSATRGTRRRGRQARGGGRDRSRLRASAHGMLAKLYADLAEADKAIEHAKKVVELEPDDAFSYTALSVIYQRCGRIPEAEHAKAMA